MGLRASAGLHGHIIAGMATSWARFRGVSIQDIYAVANWDSPHIFARFYAMNVTAFPLVHAVLSVDSSEGRNS